MPKKYPYSLCRQFHGITLDNHQSTIVADHINVSRVSYDCTHTAFLASFIQYKAFELTFVTACIHCFIHPSTQNSIV